MDKSSHKHLSHSGVLESPVTVKTSDQDTTEVRSQTYAKTAVVTADRRLVGPDKDSTSRNPGVHSYEVFGGEVGVTFLQRPPLFDEDFERLVNSPPYPLFRNSLTHSGYHNWVLSGVLRPPPTTEVSSKLSHLQCLGLRGIHWTRSVPTP